MPKPLALSPRHSASQKLSYYYLLIVPFAVAVAGFALPDIDPNTYIPIWILNACLMMIAVARLLRHRDNENGQRSTPWTWIPVLLIAPWLFISVFFGMGPPPAAIEGWVANLREQQIRYSILILAGILVPFGFAVLKEQLTHMHERTYSVLGLTAILLAAPLFMLNMIYWGFFLGEAFKGFVSSGVEKRPDWFPPVRSLLEWISTTEVTLIYLATAAFAASMKKANILGPGGANVFIGFSFAAILVNMLSAVLPGPFFVYAGYFVSIPAIPLIMPYLIGVCLLRKSPSGVSRLRSVTNDL